MNYELRIKNHKQVLEETFIDLKEDFAELLYLTDHFIFQLNKFAKNIRQVEKSIRPESLRLVEKEVSRISKRFELISKSIVIARNEVTQQSLAYASSHMREILLPTLRRDQNDTSNSSRQARTIKKLSRLEQEKNSYFDLIRTQANLISSLITSLDWQSPSFGSSQYSQAGKQTGEIKGTINDYKRDTHLDEEEFERAYIREYIDAPFKFGLRALMTSSGMSAFTTIFNFLLMEGKFKGKVLLGKSSYFQYKQLLISGLSTPGESSSATPEVSLVDELNTERIIQSIKKSQPCAIFLDSLCNAKDIPVPDLPAIINFLVKDYKKDVYLVIDNTGLSVTLQPFKLTTGRNRKVHLLLFESLMKYVHFGLDRVTGGIIVAKGRDVAKLFEYRKHLGTNIPDSSVYAFPTPNRKMLERRLKRLGRNAFILANSLEEYINNHKNCPLEKVVYPACRKIIQTMVRLRSPQSCKIPRLSRHIDGVARNDNEVFSGSFFNLEFKKKSIRLYKRFIEVAVKEAKRQKVDLIAGTSFGLNTTRVYLTSLWTKYGEPFVRVSVGTENRYQVEALVRVFIAAINKLKFVLF